MEPREEIGGLATPWSGKIAVLVTSLDAHAFPATVIPKHCRDRSDAGNCFDELKNQRGWSSKLYVEAASNSAP